MFYSAFFRDGEYTDGDKVLFKIVLNEKPEMLKYENYYAFTSGSEPIKANYGEFVYDGSGCPDFVKNVNSVTEKGAKEISVSINTGKGSMEQIVCRDSFLLYTDYKVYSDAEYTDVLTVDADYYMFDTSDDITVYLKTPTAKQYSRMPTENRPRGILLGAAVRTARRRAGQREPVFPRGMTMWMRITAINESAGVILILALNFGKG